MRISHAPTARPDRGLPLSPLSTPGRRRRAGRRAQVRMRRTARDRDQPALTGASAPPAAGRTISGVKSAMSRILYLNTHAARHGWYYGRRMPLGYRRAAKFWGSGLIDRSRTLYTGFPSASLYPIPLLRPQAVDAAGPTIDEICDQAAGRLLQEAINSGRRLDVLWSGGIDSTTALVAILRAAAAMDRLDLVEVLLTDESVKEYPEFFERFITPLSFRFVSAPVTAHLKPRRLTVTGEHGDQIFGSAKAEPYVADGRAFESYKIALPEILAESLGSNADADRVVDYIEPLLNACPIALHTIFDAFWWINFSLKWQIVGLRLAVFRVSDARRTFDSLRHFFSHPDFQLWSFRNHDKKIIDTWQSYKMPLKDYIYSFAEDEDYRQNKVKMPSLKAVFTSDTLPHPTAYRILMDEDFEPVFWEFGRRAAPVSRTVDLPERNRGR